MICFQAPHCPKLKIKKMGPPLKKEPSPHFLVFNPFPKNCLIPLIFLPVRKRKRKKWPSHNYFPDQAGKKLDGVGPVYNRPSTDKLHHFVKKTNKKKQWHVTRDMWHVTCDIWHVTRDTWHVWGGEHSLNISAPYLLPFVIYDIMKIWRKRMNHLMNNLQGCL